MFCRSTGPREKVGNLNGDLQSNVGSLCEESQRRPTAEAVLYRRLGSEEVPPRLTDGLKSKVRIRSPLTATQHWLIFLIKKQPWIKSSSRLLNGVPGLTQLGGGKDTEA